MDFLEAKRRRRDACTASRDDRSAETGALGSGGTLRCATPLRILVVDDNRDCAETLQALLVVHGHTVAVAYEGAGVAGMVERFRPDVVILDLELPDVSGFEVARRLRANPRDIVLIALTGYGDARCQASTRAAGFDHHLLKPIDFGALREALAPHAATVSRVLART